MEVFNTKERIEVELFLPNLGWSLLKHFGVRRFFIQWKL
jgi:hypothetical protein